MTPTLWHAAHGCATLAVGLALLGAIRWIGRRSRTVAAVVALAVLGRLVLVGALFWTSYLEIGALESWHSRDGFWHHALDARSYFIWAADAWEHGSSIPPGSASASYVWLLSLWMQATGPHPPGAALLNVAAFTAICALVVWTVDPRRSAAHGRACLVTVTAYALSPAGVIFSAQTLKDPSFAFFVVLSAVAFIAVLEDSRHLLARWAAVAALGLAAYMLGGMRPYYSFFQALALAPAVVLAVLLAPGFAAGLRLASLLAAAVCAVWLGFAAGAGPDYYEYERLLMGDSARSAPGSAAAKAGEAVEAARDGFVETGGATNLVALTDDVGPGASGPVALLAKLRGVVFGLLVMFVPVSLLRGLGLVTFEGGRGLLVITDLDTVFLLVSIVCVAHVMRKDWWPVRRHVPFVVFTVGLALLLSVLMAYVVTNFGTLFRLRLMVATLVWSLPLAMAGTAPPPAQAIPE